MATVSKKKRASGNPATTVSAISEVKDLLTQFESFIKEAEALAAMEIRRIDEMKEALKTALVHVGAQFKEKEELLRSRDAAMREMEETLTAKIRDLENSLREKEPLLRAHDASQKDLDFKIDAANTPGERHFTLGEQAAASMRNLEQGLRQGTQAGRSIGEETQNSQERAPAGPETQAIDRALREAGAKPGMTKRPQGEEQKSSRLRSLLAPIKRRG